MGRAHGPERRPDVVHVIQPRETKHSSPPSNITHWPFFIHPPPSVREGAAPALWSQHLHLSTATKVWKHWMQSHHSFNNSLQTTSHWQMNTLTYGCTAVVDKMCYLASVQMNVVLDIARRIRWGWISRETHTSLCQHSTCFPSLNVLSVHSNNTTVIYHHMHAHITIFHISLSAETHKYGYMCTHQWLQLITINWLMCYMTTTQQQPFYGPLSGTTRVSRYQKKHSPTHHPVIF